MDGFDRLLRGFSAFRAGRWSEPGFRALVQEGQSPQVLCIACSDSRVDPALVFDTAPGELFTIRNVANIVPPHAPDQGLHGVSAAIEFAVQVLRVRHVVVCGHSRCGGIRALVAGLPAASADTYLARWVQLGEPARRQMVHDHPSASLEEQLRACERANVALGLERLRSFPFVAAAEQAATLFLHGLYVRIGGGELERLTPDGWTRVG